MKMRSKSEPSSSGSSKKSRKELPRKAAKICRTFPEPGVEKTELRFVLYKDPDGKYNRDKFLQEVAEFFSEQARRIAEKEQLSLPSLPVAEEKKVAPLGNSPRCQKRLEKAEKKNKWKCSLYQIEPPSEPGIVLVRDVMRRVKEEHHEQSCLRSKALRSSLPVIKKLIEKISSMSDNKKCHKDLQAILKTAEQCYVDAEKCLRDGGPIGDQLCDRIMRLNKMAATVLMAKKATMARTVYSSTSVSSVNAASDSSNICPNNRRR